VKVRGRFWVGVWLLFFLAVLAGVVTRQTSSHVAAAQLRELQEQRSVLEAERMRLLRRIREGRSRATLVPRAESLGLRAVEDSQIVQLEMPREGRR
jgi:hypothetical protein